MSKRKPSKTRIVRYGWHKPDGEGYSVRDLFSETAMEEILADARQRGVVTQYDTGRGAIVWFEGPPGEALREVRVDVLALLPDDVVPV